MKIFLGLSLVSVLLASCATTIKGSTQAVSIDSNVKGAEIVVNGETVGTTPYNGPIKKDPSTTVTIKKEGYQSKTIVLNTNFEPTFFGNILFLYLGVFSTTTDYMNSSMYKYAPATFQIDLEKVAQLSLPSDKKN
ncbi:MAG: PEGA domain-containing protein [Bacteriovorax sp.]